jgi:hypothetical protein
MLAGAVRLWPTARNCTAMQATVNPDAKFPPSLPEHLARAGLLDQGSHSTSGSPRGSLNSKWAATLMGYPSDWCELPSDVLDALTAKR